MEKERIEEIKNWLAKVTLGKKSCVIDLTRATREIPRLLTALEAAQREAEVLRQAVGLATTIKGDMEINVNDPVGMMQEVVKHVNQLKENLALARAGGQIVALRKEAAGLREALDRMLKMHNMMMQKGNHAKSFYDAKTIREMNEAPIQGQQALARTEKEGGG